jgi:hypothetical protein
MLCRTGTPGRAAPCRPACMRYCPAARMSNYSAACIQQQQFSTWLFMRKHCPTVCKSALPRPCPRVRHPYGRPQGGLGVFSFH